MNDKQLLALFGLKWNPFLPNIPVEALWSPPGMDNFIFRIENLVMDGGFALICGEPGLGKSKNLQILSHRLGRLEDVVVGVMERPQSSLSDLYREMGHLFGVNLSPANRYGGFKALRERWQEHIKSTLFRPVLLVDEAQEMVTCCLNELRLLGSADFDSRCLLTVVLSGDLRLPERFRSSALVSLGSRMRLRMMLEPYSKDVLHNYMKHALQEAGAPHLMSQTLVETLVDHASGNLRLLNTMAADLLDAGAQKELTQLDEKLFLEIFSRNPATRGHSPY
ncbi:MAG: general secretion pathway protein GspA [Desulfuromonadales bacterium C00003096]|jgi:type II secretory pathway predicted ATPase ExeA|nr:MAG: general secretion pathway protein GspA [Desulfuromonadales bacterium C00003096]